MEKEKTHEREGMKNKTIEDEKKGQDSENQS